MNNIIYLGLFGLGIAFGSFLNVASLRYEPEKRVFARKSIGGRSRCVHCLRTLRWYELLPLISFIFLRKKCSTCKGNISWQYPIVELISGLVFVLVPYYLSYFFGLGNFLYLRPYLWSFYILIFAWIVIFSLFLLLSVIDIRRYLIPNELTLALLVFGVLVVVLKVAAGNWLLPFFRYFLGNYALIFSPFQNVIVNHLIGFVGAGAFFWMLHTFTGGRAIGFGDVKLAFALGLILGYPDITLSMMLAFVLGGIWGVILIIFQGKKLSSKLPFGPFMVTGVLLTFFFGRQILSWYFGLFM